MRRPSTIELMLLATVFLWALNLTVTRYILTHGFAPLPYATYRYGLATAIFIAIVLVGERTLRIARRDLPLVGLAALFIFLNQLSFVYALDRTSASTIALILGATPAFAALIGLVLGLERLSRRFWLAAGISFAATWAAYSVAVGPLMQRYSASRISVAALGLAWIGIALVGLPHTVDQDLDVGWKVWTLLLFATLGPLVLTTILWFRVIHRIGASRATLVANLQPFVAAIFALVLLSEQISLLQVLGGLLIAGGILTARRRPPAPAPD
jgi:drug/metabolite transporter (DMT)-like permease